MDRVKANGFRMITDTEAPGRVVKNLEAFCKKLEADGIKLTVPYRTVPALGVAIAFFTDPWGTYIELTEGLDKVSSGNRRRAASSGGGGSSRSSPIRRP